MKKIAKISLVAAVAVASFTSANAQALEEAIKNVDVSGSAVYRYNDIQDDAKAASKDATNNNYKVGLNLSSKVNEDVKFNTRFLATNDTTKGNFTSLDTSKDGDSNVSVALSNANFAYTGVKNTTVTVGKQGLATPYTTPVMIDENEQTGTGALALSTVGPVTLGAAYFNETNLGTSGELASKLSGAKDVSAVAAIGTFGPVTADAWFLDLADTFDTFTLGAKSDLDLSGVKLGVDARYASLTLEDAVAKALRGNANYTDNSIAKLVLTAKAGIVNAKVAYATTDKDGGITGLDSDAVTVLKGWNLHTLDKTDADYWQVVAGVDILSNLNLSANYGNLQYINAVKSTIDVEEEEVYGQLTYKMSKNLTTYVRGGTYTKDYSPVDKTKNIDATAGRLQVAYTF